jgi:hypothetical protein
MHYSVCSYNVENDLEEGAEETGWKLVHGEVFRYEALSY